MNYLINLFLLQGLIFLTLGATAVEAALSIEDCQKCHDRECQQIASKGMAHKEMLTCLECHESHRPKAINNIPECNNCHGDSPHESIIDCSGCHKRKKNCKACHMAHQPFVWSDSKVALLHCKACHPRASQLLMASASQHHTLSCTFCHTEHREIQKCSDCHGQPHPEGTHQLFPQCATCHNVAHDLNPVTR